MRVNALGGVLCLANWGEEGASVGPRFNAAIAEAVQRDGLAGLTARGREQTSESPPGFAAEGEDAAGQGI